MCGWSQLLSGHKEATSYPQTHVSATVCVLWRDLWPWGKVVRSRLSRVSFSQIYWALKKKILLFCAKALLELVLDYRAQMRRASVTTTAA